MGGERETTLPANRSTDLGKGIRLHESGGQVHFHDDKQKLKIAIPAAEFWDAWKRLKDERLTTFLFTDVQNNSKLDITIDATNDAMVTLSKGEEYGAVFQAIDKFVNG